MNRLGDTSAFVIPVGQLLLTGRGKTRMYTVGIVFEFCTVPLQVTSSREEHAFTQEFICITIPDMVYLDKRQLVAC